MVPASKNYALLVGQVEQEYQETALDNEIITKISKMSIDNKVKLLKTLELWEDTLRTP